MKKTIKKGYILLEASEDERIQGFGDSKTVKIVKYPKSYKCQVTIWKGNDNPFWYEENWNWARRQALAL